MQERQIWKLLLLIKGTIKKKIPIIQKLQVKVTTRQKQVTVRVEAKAMMLRLCIVKDPEELEALYNDDRSELEELINNELGSEDSEYFEEIYTTGTSCVVKM